jgi:short-subunit dehydrogenase
MSAHEDQQKLLGKVPLFAGCTPEELAEAAACLSVIDVPSGTAVVSEGAPGDSMYVIATGTVRIVAESRDGEVIAQLESGDFFGEMALITGLPRTATALAVSDTRLWKMEKDDFDRMIREMPHLSLEMSRVLSQRVQRAAPVGRDLVGRTALLTGASKGIGIHVARALAREGMNLMLTARTADALEEVRKEVESMGVRAVAMPGDVSSPAHLQALVVRAISEFGAIDLLVNNAGLLLTLPFHKVYPHEIDGLVAVNLNGPMFLSWLVLPGMLERRAGHVVNIASIAGKYGPAYNELYSSSKAGLVAFTQSFRASYRASGVSASVLCPGFVESGMYERSRRHGLRAPRLLGSTTPEAVAEAVVHAVKKDKPEMVLNTGPIRLLLALPTLLPSVAEWARIKLGTDNLYRKAAAIRTKRREETGR